MKKISFDSVDILMSRVKDGTFHEIIDDWKWILKYSVRYKWAIFCYVLMGILSTSFGLASSVAGKYVIDIITGRQMSKLATVLIIMVGTAIVSIALDSVISRVSAKISINIHNDIQSEVFDKVVDADWMAMNQYSYGDILNRFHSDISVVSSNAVTWLPTIIIAIYRFAATFFVILHYDVIMAIIALGSAPVLLITSKYMISKQRDFNKKMRETSSELTAFEVESFYNIDTIKSFGIGELYSRKMKQMQQKYKDITLQHNWFSVKTHAMMSGMGQVLQMIAFGYCLFRLWTNDITYGTMTLFLQQRSNLTTAFQNTVSIVPSFLNSSVSAHRIRELAELPKEKHILESKNLEALAADGFKVELKNVDFSYQADNRIIENASFVACPGEIVALVGPSGEGKTTMLRLILGLIHPQRGHAYIQGQDGSCIEMNAETRKLFSYVPQGNAILSGTIAENMRMVKEHATDEEIIEALKTACAWEFIEKLPDTIYSKVRERGKGLSEGQAQRISIARAILRDAPILMLDEATSALDVATERRVLKNIMLKSPKKTCIVTTHRPSVLNMCQRVYRVTDKSTSELTKEDAEQLAMDF